MSDEPREHLPGGGVMGRWWRRLPEGEGAAEGPGGPRFVCELCPRECHLRPGQRGFCFVRQATDSGVALRTWGRSSGFCVDPIEKKPLNHWLPGTPVLSFGTAGCNLGCRFCQNWGISNARETDSLLEVATPGGIARAAVRTGSRSVAFTYNDPVISAEYALDVAAACREAGVHTVAVTAGYISTSARGEFFGAMDAANIDLKAFTERFYKRLCYGALEPVKETIAAVVAEGKTWVELTTLIIPGENDSDAELHALTSWVRESLGPQVPLHFTAYHPNFKLQVAPTSIDALNRARAIARVQGLQFVYSGNVWDTVGGSTFCPHCAALLVERDTYDLGHWGLDAHGACATCGTAVPGRFEARPGKWGGRRLPVSIGE